MKSLSRLVEQAKVNNDQQVSARLTYHLHHFIFLFIMIASFNGEPKERKKV